MATTGLFCGIFFTVSLAFLASAGFVSPCKYPITCPCGHTRRAVYYTHCLNDTLEEEITCEIWANCKTCEVNTTNCLISNDPERSGPTCAEVKEKLVYTCPDPGVPENGVRLNEDGEEDTNTFPRTFQDGELAYFSCDEGDFSLEGAAVIRCTPTGDWSDPLPRCQKHEKVKPASEMFCKYPGVDRNGIIEGSETSGLVKEDQMFPSTTRLKYKCREGYRLVGQKALFCLCSGEWTANPPTCIPDYAGPHCEDRGPISNGRVIEYRNLETQFPSYEEYGALYPVGTRLHYSCNKGYALRGAKIVICVSSGLWSGEEPKCIEDPNQRGMPTTNYEGTNKNFNPNDDDNLRKKSIPKDGNLIRNFVTNSRSDGTLQEKRSTGNSNSLTFNFFF